jgi:GNAT superfamily N-acetyltransferase
MTDEPRPAGPVPAGHLRVTVTSLAMHGCPDSAKEAPDWQEGAHVERAVRPGVAFYRFLYGAVGEGWLWTERRRWSDATLAARIQDPGVEVWVLTADGQPAGYAELDRRDPADVELSYFGLLPAFIGRGLGSRFLRFAVHRAWRAETRRFWVHTCDLDHPAALGVYHRAGFVPFRTDVTDEPDPRLSGSFPLTASPHRPVATP